MTNIANWKMAIERCVIVSFPMKDDDFSWFSIVMLVYQQSRFFFLEGSIHENARWWSELTSRNHWMSLTMFNIWKCQAEFIPTYEKMHEISFGPPVATGRPWSLHGLEGSWCARWSPRVHLALCWLQGGDLATQSWRTWHMDRDSFIEVACE